MKIILLDNAIYLIPNSGMTYVSGFYDSQTYSGVLRKLRFQTKPSVSVLWNDYMSDFHDY